eukprot:CAMPEP_0194371152 /NCGR_PEP_ID=MMETSP0174-20130528/19532_1 /TAXON_ID=216777 /ORGANISM="Proboscia alata, Strain PI-D3" /LENGTH=186 /DNA_ID=CAMNT_0039149039 /DNA_START=1068 /DNA_END=1628 /DNA_ORIENTATION=-
MPSPGMATVVAGTGKAAPSSTPTKMILSENLNSTTNEQHLQQQKQSFALFVSSLLMYAVYTAVLVGLTIGFTIVAAGLKPRLIVLVLMLMNPGYVFYEHPFFRFVWQKNGEWVYDEENMPFPNVTLSTDVGLGNFEPEQIYDLHQCYFSLGLFTLEALLLLAQHGLSKIAAQKDEVLIPVVARNQD